MGLDMYLYARKQSFRSYGTTEDDGPRKAMVAAADELGLPNCGNIDSITVQREVAYWRKANAIHDWFVQNHQGGKDECQPSSTMYKDDLQKLRDLCAELLVNKDPAEAVAKLPPCGGFFFGSTEINDWFWQDLTNTVDQLDKALAIPGDVTFQYRSSW